MFYNVSKKVYYDFLVFFINKYEQKTSNYSGFEY